MTSVEHTQELQDLEPSVSKWDRKRAYGVHISAVQVLLPIALHCELVKSPSVVPMPNSPSWFVGVLNLRGNLVPVYDISPLISAADSNGAQSMFGQGAARRAPAIKELANVVVVGEGDYAAALVCQGAPKTLDITEIPASKNFDLLSEDSHQLFNNSYIVAGQTWFELDPKKTFSLLAEPLRT